MRKTLLYVNESVTKSTDGDLKVDPSQDYRLAFVDSTTHIIVGFRFDGIFSR